MLFISRPISKTWRSYRLDRAYFHHVPPLHEIDRYLSPYPSLDRYQTFDVPAFENLSWNLYNYTPGEKRPLVIYLPPVSAELLLSRSGRPQKRPFHRLLSVIPPQFSKFCVARINWSGGRKHPYPVPFDSVSRAFKAITSHVSLEGRKIGVCGSYQGGGLAMSLVLAKNLSGRPRTISALSVHNAIFDWTYMATHPACPPFYPDISQLKHDYDRRRAADSLMRTYAQMRNMFASPADCFNPLASPMLFFRKSYFEIPTTFPPKPQDEKPFLEYEDGKEIEEAWPWTRNPSLLCDFPPAASRLVIPTTRITFQDTGILQRQAQEMASLIRHNLTNPRGGHGDQSEDHVLSKQEAEQKCLLIDGRSPEGETNKDVFRQNQRKREDMTIEWLGDSLRTD